MKFFAKERVHSSVDQGGVSSLAGFRRRFSSVTVESMETESETTLTVSSVLSKLRALVLCRAGRARGLELPDIISLSF